MIFAKIAKNPKTKASALCFTIPQHFFTDEASLYTYLGWWVLGYALGILIVTSIN